MYTSCKCGLNGSITENHPMHVGIGIAWRRPDRTHEPRMHIMRANSASSSFIWRFFVWGCLSYSNKTLFEATLLRRPSKDTLGGHCCGTLFEDTLLEDSCETFLWHSCAALFRDTLLRHSRGTLFKDDATNGLAGREQRIIWRWEMLPMV